MGVAQWRLFSGFSCNEAPPPSASLRISSMTNSAASLSLAILHFCGPFRSETSSGSRLNAAAS